MERAELENAEVAGDDDEEENEGMGNFSGDEGNDENNDKEDESAEED